MSPPMTPNGPRHQLLSPPFCDENRFIPHHFSLFFFLFYLICFVCFFIVITIKSDVVFIVRRERNRKNSFEIHHPWSWGQVISSFHFIVFQSVIKLISRQIFIRRYKCEVSTEAPHFNTDYREENLTVYGQLNNQFFPIFYLYLKKWHLFYFLIKKIFTVTVLPWLVTQPTIWNRATSSDSPALFVNQDLNRFFLGSSTVKRLFLVIINLNFYLTKM